MTEPERNAFFNMLRQLHQVTEQCPSVGEGEVDVSFKGATINIGVSKSTPASDKIPRKHGNEKGKISVNYPVSLFNELAAIV